MKASSIKHQASSTKALIGVLAFSLLAGCSTLTNKEVGQINFNYSTPEQQKDTGKIIAIVAPDFKDRQAASQQPVNPLLAMAMAQQGNGLSPLDFNLIFQQSYRGQLITALQNTFNEIISKQGFRTADYSTFDDMTYTDKKKTYLASVPKLSLNIDKKVTKSNCGFGYCTEQGIIQISGELNVSLVEPLTSQTFINKRINLSDFNISENYIIQKDSPAPQGFMALFNGLFKPAQYQDNSDKALVDALNKFYTKSADKITQYISREELLSLSGEIENLKGIKRF